MGINMIRGPPEPLAILPSVVWLEVERLGLGPPGGHGGCDRAHLMAPISGIWLSPMAMAAPRPEEVTT